MRLVYRASRDVKLRRLVHSSPLDCVRPATLLGPAPSVARLPGAPVPLRRAYSAAPEPEVASSSVYANAVVVPSVPPSRRNDRAPRKALVQPDKWFGRWRLILHDPRRLAWETDFENKQGLRKAKEDRLLVDTLVYQNDIELWSCLLDYLRRHRGDEGTAELWRALWGRKVLYTTDSPAAVNFWYTMAETAVRSGSDKFMENVWLYAEWMANVHQTKWPRLYTTIIPHLLRTRQHNKAVNWHLRLSQRFLPPPHKFVNMLQQFAVEPDLSRTLQMLYKMSHQRRMYDVLVPYLYDQGHARLAREWRKTFLAVGDQPTVYAPVRPFLRYMAGYWETKGYKEAERAAMDFDKTASKEPGPADQQLEMTREFVNRVHGKTFGFTPKAYNDRLGARWFASSWVSLDTAISVVLALGIQEIGPLSLQSIALREKTPEAVMNRFRYLQAHNIAVPRTNYVRVMRYLANTQEDELLADLLASDIHPEVFDDLSLQAELMQSSSESGDWSTYTLLLAAKLAMFESWSRDAANALLMALLARGRYQAVLNTLDDMKAMRVPLDADAASQLMDFIRVEVPLHPNTDRPSTVPDSCRGLVRRLLALDVPLPVAIWRRLIFSQARSGRLADAQQVVLDALDFFTADRHDRPGHVPVHKVDLPRLMAEPLTGVENLIGVYIPLDTPFYLSTHPMANIFDGPLLSSLIRWSFRAIAEIPKAQPLLLAGPGDFDFVNTLRIIRKLRDAGLNVPVAAVRKSIVYRLAELYGRAMPTKASHMAARRMNMIPLNRMRDMCNQAWGAPILPEDLGELKQLIRQRDAKREQLHRYFEHANAEKREEGRGPRY